MATPAAAFFSSYQTPSAYAETLAESMGLNKLAANVGVGWTSALSAAKARGLREGVVCALTLHNGAPRSA